jgi:hypothetical protein
VNRFLHRIVNWLRVGYPQGIPPTDYIPLLALLSRRLTNDEVETVATTATPRWKVAPGRYRTRHQNPAALKRASTSCS